MSYYVYENWTHDRARVHLGSCGHCQFKGAGGGGGPALGPSESCPNIGEDRTDGINVGIDQIQGTRSYDSFTENWTTPDAYEGNPSDPISQQKYVWNNNNPIAYSDPSGYVGVEAGPVPWTFSA